MRLAKVFFVIFVVLFALLGEQVFAQVQCQEFTPTASGRNCYVQYFIPWVAYGGGWASKLRGANISPGQDHGPVQFFWSTRSQNGKYALTVFYSDNKWPTPGASQGANHWVKSGESIEVIFLSPMAGCDEIGYNCSKIPDPETLVTGTITVGYMASDPAWLRGLPRPSLQFNYVGGLQATEPALDPAPIWRSPATVSTDRHEDYSFAIGNPGKEEITVQGTITNEKAINLGVQTWTIPPGGTMGVYIVSPRDTALPGFGSDPFPDGKNFTGWIEFRVISPAGGGMALMAIQYTGNAMSTADIQRFDK